MEPDAYVQYETQQMDEYFAGISSAFLCFFDGFTVKL